MAVGSAAHASPALSGAPDVGGVDAGGGRPRSLRVAVCQINPTVGDLDHNVALATEALARAEAAGADVAVLPELALTGYPPEDLVLRPGFVMACRHALESFASATGDCAAVVGFVEGLPDDDADGSGADVGSAGVMGGVENTSEVYNSAAVCANGEVRGVYRKRHLPNYDVFDEARHFRSRTGAAPLFEIGGALVGITVCEDAWIPDGPISDLARAGAQLVLTINGSPFRAGKQAVREQVVTSQVHDAGIPVVFVNLVGGQDELVFDGGSFVVDTDGSVVARCVSFEESVDVFDVEIRPPLSAVQTQLASDRRVFSVTPRPAATDKREALGAPLVAEIDVREQLWSAMVLATRDYVHKSGFTDVCVGLSGGVDSSLTAAVAVDALGADHVHGVLMPSRHSSEHSVTDAEKLAANLGIDARIVEIEPGHAALSAMIESGLGAGLVSGGLTDQNLQSRVRGVTLMALANECGWLVLTTGNKSELAVGYSTLYGDTAGAFAVISDLWKLEVYELCRWRNQRGAGELIPETVLTKAPSAELAPGQLDEDSLPPYEVLDPILRRYVEDLQSVPEIQAAGIASAEMVERVCRLVDIAEYKRRQTPIGPRLSARAFGRDRRMPINNRFSSRAY